MRINPEKYKILLIGVSQYPREKQLPNLPAVKTNVKRLYDIFTNSHILGVPRQNIILSIDENKIDIERKLVRFFKHFVNADDTAIIYYSGHGLVSPENLRVYLATKDTSFKLLEAESIEIGYLRSLFNSIITKKKVLFIDACYSGQIHNDFDVNSFTGGYIITSTSDNLPALYPRKAPKNPTYFTGEMIRILHKGLKNQKPYISVAELYREMTERLKKKNLPIPVKSTHSRGNHIIIAKNVYGHRRKPNSNTLSNLISVILPRRKE